MKEPRVILAAIILLAVRYSSSTSRELVRQPSDAKKIEIRESVACWTMFKLEHSVYLVTNLTPGLFDFCC